MAYFHTTVLDEQIKALPTVDTASGSIATFDTDMTENLVEVKCQIVAQQSGSGTPSPSNPRPITTYTSLNLSHSGADTSNPTVYNIPFGQTVANGVLDVTTGKLRVTHGVVDMGDLSWTYHAPSVDYSAYFDTFLPSDSITGDRNVAFNGLAEIYTIIPSKDIALSGYDNNVCALAHGTRRFITCDTRYTDATSYTNAMNGIMLVYPLATPIEIQLDSITLQALLNENNIWCDTGDSSVKYILSVGKKIS